MKDIVRYARSERNPLVFVRYEEILLNWRERVLGLLSKQDMNERFFITLWGFIYFIMIDIEFLWDIYIRRC